MKRFLIALTVMAAPLLATASVGIAVNVGAPDYYGPIQVRNMRPPQVMYSQPILIQPSRGVEYSPIYLRVPRHHYRHWHRYCGYYSACARPVYFVDDYWYQTTYAPMYYRPYHHHGWHHRW